MNVRSLAVSMAAVTCGLAITIVSCNSDKDGIANMPNQPAHGGKADHLLAANCNATSAVSRCGVGAASVEYQEDNGELVGTNLNDATQDGISSTFDPAHRWHQVVNAAIAEQAGLKVIAVAYNAGDRQGQLEIARETTDPTFLRLTPTFYAGDGNYSVEVYNHGTLVARQDNVPVGSGTEYRIKDWYTEWVEWWIRRYGGGELAHGKGAHTEAAAVTESGACVWSIRNDPGPAVQIKLPDGSTVDGNEIRFAEIVDGSGRYPYHTVDRVDILTNIGTYKIRSEYAGD